MTAVRSAATQPAATPPVFDGHNDAAWWLANHPRVGVRQFLEGGGGRHLDLLSVRAGNLIGGLFALFADGGVNPPPAPRPWKQGWEVPAAGPIDPQLARSQVLGMLAALLRLEREADGSVRIVRTVPELRAAMRAGQLAVVVHLEGADSLDRDLHLLDVLVEAGLRSLGPVWSRPNAFGHGAPFRCPADPDVGPGLTRLGRRLVRECNERGLLLDLAHLNARGFRDAAAISRAPLVVSHTAVHGLVPAARNITDAQIDAVGASGGLVGIFFSVRHLSYDGHDDPATGLARIAEHLEYVAERIGVDHVGLGSDFDGTRMSAAMPGAAGLPALLTLLRARGWSAADVRKLAHGNWLRVLEASWRPS